jgi:tetratricopeptide (TPR) repeat protein
MGRFSKLETSQQKTESPEKCVAELAATPEDEIAYDARHYCRQADEAYFAGNFRKALQLYSRATQSEATCVEAWVGQILSLLALNEKREAVAWINRAIELLPEHPRIVALQGLVFANQGMVSRGLQCSDWAMSKGAGDPYVWLFRGQVLALANNKNAPFCMEKALEAGKNEGWTLPAHIGYFYLQQAVYPLAEKYLMKALECEGTRPMLWYQLGRAQTGMGKWEAARRSFETALKLDPHFRAASQELENLNKSSWLARFLAPLLRRRK